MADFNSLLVANRGEIALRVMRTARSMGLRTIAVYSEADADSPHVAFADQAVAIGPSPPGLSYLCAEKILAAARESGADAVHPGYGFLSENAGFARAVFAAGLVFIGPSVDAIEIMGDKARAKRAMIAAGVPCVPGYQGEDQDVAHLLREAGRIGVPIMVKAAAGGGGRGMRLVNALDELAPALAAARSEAENAFGSGDLILEKAVLRPHHVEIQVFGDSHGQVIHLGERDCSVQRRHQKIIEEAPSPIMTETLRQAMGDAAVSAARAVNYWGAGTVEFLVDEERNFYFLEMNTRLQVEHAVTEEITGLDLVALQIRIARGEKLGLRQEEVRLNGHAIEARLYAEDAGVGFLPSAGTVRYWHPPSGSGIRVDAGLVSGGEISSFYDPMVAKVIAHGATREDARRRLIRALQQTALFGPKTNRDFLIEALSRAQFANGSATTAFIFESFGAAGYAAPAPDESEIAAAALLHYRLRHRALRHAAPRVSAELMDWSSSADLQSVFDIEADGQVVTVSVCPMAEPAVYRAILAGKSHVAQLRRMDDHQAEMVVGGRPVNMIFASDGPANLHCASARCSFLVNDLAQAVRGSETDSGSGVSIAPMHGLLLSIFVQAGDRVTKGDQLAVLEAMKMQVALTAQVDGVVALVHATAGRQVACGDVILEISGDPEQAREKP